jgi:transposase
VLAGAQRDRHPLVYVDEAHILVYVDEAHIHQDADLGYGWAERGQRFWVASTSPGLSARVSFYGLYFYNEGQGRVWPYRRANGDHPMDVLQRLRAEVPERKLIVLWDGAPYHRAQAVREVAGTLDITLMPLPGYSPDLMPVEALWRWLRADVTYHHCDASADDLTRRVADFEVRINQDPCALTKTRVRSPTASGSKTASTQRSTQRRRNYGSQPRWGIVFSIEWNSEIFETDQVE